MFDKLFSPLEIGVMLECYIGGRGVNWPILSWTSRLASEARDRFFEAGLLDEDFDATERGKAWVQRILSVPFPEGHEVPLVRTQFSLALEAELADVRAMLIAKNQAYGNSALDPVRVFSKADTVEQIKVRLDDKLSRLARGDNAGEDVETDLLGYLFLLRIARRRAAKENEVDKWKKAMAEVVEAAAIARGEPQETANDLSRDQRDAAFSSSPQEGKKT